MLLAFCISNFSSAQELKSLSGANSPQDDQNPVWIGDNVLLFTRAFHPLNLGGESDPGDIWMTKKDEQGVWGEAIHRADLSTDGYDFALGLEDVLTLLVYHKGSGRNGLYQYSKFGTDWNFLRQVNFEGLEELQGQLLGRVAKGGKLIFLSAKGPDNYGNEDLYISEKIGIIDWGKAVNLGSAINTKGQEMSPYYNPSTQLLYFSSNMHDDAEGKDIFISKKTGEDWKSWSKPERWELISSRGSDVSVTFISDDEVVWSSTRNSDGFADLMTFSTKVPLEIPQEFSTAPPAILPPKKALADVSNNKSSNEEVTLAPIYPKSSIGKPEVSMEQIQQMAEAKPVAEVTEAQTPEENPVEWLVLDGKNSTRLDYEMKFFNGKNEVIFEDSSAYTLSFLKESNVNLIKVKSAGFFPKELTLKDINPLDKTVVLMTKLESGSVLLLENVNFKRGTAELEGEETEAVLSELAEFLSENSSVKLRINGHTDGGGDPSLNKGLSLDRARSVRDYLVDHGVTFENLRIAGWGGTRPIASNATESGRSKNRRVELEVIQ